MVGVTAQNEALNLAAGLCRKFEGLRLTPYLCPAGILTIGYGSTRYADGRAVTLRDPAITEAKANELLLLTLRKRVDAGDWAGARAELAKWVRGGGRVLLGLVARRAAESKLMEV